MMIVIRTCQEVTEIWTVEMINAVDVVNVAITQKTVTNLMIDHEAVDVSVVVKMVTKSRTVPSQITDQETVAEVEQARLTDLV